MRDPAFSDICAQLPATASFTLLTVTYQIRRFRRHVSTLFCIQIRATLYFINKTISRAAFVTAPRWTDERPEDLNVNRLRNRDIPSRNKSISTVVDNQSPQIGYLSGKLMDL